MLSPPARNAILTCELFARPSGDGVIGLGIGGTTAATPIGSGAKASAASHADAPHRVIQLAEASTALRVVTIAPFARRCSARE
jgi:hypothetical protein